MSRAQVGGLDRGTACRRFARETPTVADTSAGATMLPFAGTPLGPEVEAQLTDLWSRLSAAQQAKVAATLAVVKDSGAAVRVTIGNMKGGVAKSTTTIFFALLLAFLGEPVLLVDGDGKNTSCLLWKLGAGDDWPMNVQVMPWATPDLAKQVQAMEGQFRHLVIDTSPQLEDVLQAGLFVTDTFVIVSLPNPMDIAQVDQSVDLAVTVDGQKRVFGGELAAVILLVRAKQENSRLLTGAKRYLDDKDYPYLSVPIISRDPYADMFGAFPWDFADYIDAFAEFVAYALGLDFVPGTDLDEEEA